LSFEAEVLKANRIAYRDETIRTFIQEVQKDIKKGIPVVMGGDFNEPSHLDWLDNTKIYLIIMELSFIGIVL